MREKSLIMPLPAYFWILDDPSRGSTREVTTLIRVESTMSNPTTAATHSMSVIPASSPNAGVASATAPATPAAFRLGLPLHPIAGGGAPHRCVGRAREDGTEMVESERELVVLVHAVRVHPEVDADHLIRLSFSGIRDAKPVAVAHHPVAARRVDRRARLGAERGRGIIDGCDSNLEQTHCADRATAGKGQMEGAEPVETRPHDPIST